MVVAKKLHNFFTARERPCKPDGRQHRLRTAVEEPDTLRKRQRLANRIREIGCQGRINDD